MTDLEKLKTVAKVLGWTDIGVEIERGWVGKPPDRLGYHPIPNWAEDLPACMAPGGPWEWLCLHTEAVNVLSYQTSDGRFTYVNIYLLTEQHPIRMPESAAPTAICNAVLAVSEKLKEQGDA